MYIGFIGIDGSRCHTGDIYTIDTSDLSQDDVYDRIYKIIEEVMK